jgi:hypothetical protein
LKILGLVLIGLFLGYSLHPANYKKSKPEATTEVNPVVLENLQCPPVQKANCEKELQKLRDYYQAQIAATENVPKEQTDTENVKEEKDKLTFTYLKPEQVKSQVFGVDSLLDHIPDPSLIDRASKFVLSDPVLFFARASLLNSIEVMEPLNGTYNGKLYLHSGEKRGEVHDIELTINYRFSKEEELDGQYILRMSRQGNVYTNRNGSGGNNNVFTNENTLILNAGQGYKMHFKGPKLRIGNYYDREKLIGLVVLNRY